MLPIFITQYIIYYGTYIFDSYWIIMHSLALLLCYNALLESIDVL